MSSDFLTSLFKRPDTTPFVSVDIGTSAIKLMTLDTTKERPVLLNVGLTATPAQAISNNSVTRPEQIAASIRAVLEANDIQEKRATIAIPGPAAFTKKITIAYCEPRELETNIRFEAGNYIPHSVDAVHLDYQVLKTNGTATMEVLLVAVKNEIIRSYIAAVEQAGLEPSIADVDYFALENMFEMNYPEEKDKTVALINIGARYSSVSIIQHGESLFSGDVGVGGRLYTDALVETMGMKPVEAERVKSGHTVDGVDANLVHETLDRTTEHIASELHRQLGFFWNAAATDKGIESIFVSGGAARAPGLLDELSARTGMICHLIEPFRSLDRSQNLDEALLDELKLSMGVSVGLATRRFGDKTYAG
ncbi:MAG: type IV pilus assembly protein PilM [Bdellovibrionales bacterium]|nr:type IV pilus assembly protein PilM [Bdellovibrionales bacterium]